MQNSFTSQYKNFALLNSTKKPGSFSHVITSAKSIKLNTRNKGYLSDNKISLSTELLNDYTYKSPEKNKFRSKYHQRTHKSENYAEQALTTPNNRLKKKMSGFRNQINLKKKRKKHISIDLTNGVNSPISMYRCYPYTANHNKCVSLTEKDMIKGLKGNAYYESKEEELQSFNNNNSTFKKNASIQFQQSVPLYFWDKRSNSNSTNVTSLKDQLSDYNDVSSMLGGRLNFKKNLRGQGGYFKLVSDISSHFSKFNKKLQKIIQKETKQEDNNAQNEDSNNTLDEIKHIQQQSETENECEKELINNIHMNINNHILDSEDNSISSKDEIDNNPFLESQINQTLSKFKLKNKNKLFMKQLSRISEISVKQSNNDSTSNIEIEKTDHIQTKTLKNKLKNLNEILTNNTPVDTEGNKEAKRPLSNKDSSKRNMLMIKENNIKKTKDDSIIQTSSNVKIGIHDNNSNKGISNKKTYSLYYEMSSAMESSSSFSGDKFLMKKCKTNVNTDFLIYSNFSKNKKIKNSNTNLLDNSKENNCISQKEQKLLNFFLNDIEDNTYEEKNEKLKDHFLAKSINSVTKYLADIVDFDPEDSMMNHDEVGTKSYFKPIKHSKSKHNEDMFLYIHYYSYNFYRKMNRYQIPRTVISSNIEDKSDCIFVHYNSINKSLANYIRENCLIAHKEMIDYLFYGRYSEFKNKSMIENFIKEERHRRERIKTIRKNITKKLKEKTTIVFDNNVILYNSHLMTRDIKYDNTSINLKFIRAYQQRESTLLGKTKKQRNSNLLTQKKRSPKMLISTKISSPDTQFKNSKTSDINIRHTNKFDEKVLEKEITSKFALRSQSLSPIALISNNTKNNLVLNSDAHYVNNRNTQSTSTFNSRLNYPLLQKESVLLRTYEIKNNIINNLNTLAESIIFHIKDGNYHNFLELMTKYKIDPNTRDKDGNTFLILAVNSNSSDIVDYLIKKDFDVNAFNNNHNTALHYAILHRNFDLVDYLIRNGADENIKNLDGKTPWECLDSGITLNSYEYE